MASKTPGEFCKLHCFLSRRVAQHAHITQVSTFNLGCLGEHDITNKCKLLQGLLQS